MAKEKLVTIHVHTPFTLTLNDQSKQEFGKGRHNVPEAVASHWFTQAHSDLSENAVSEDDELNQLKTLLSQREEQLKANQDTIDALNKQIEDLNAQLAASLIGGEGESNAKEPGPANRK